MTAPVDIECPRCKADAGRNCMPHVPGLVIDVAPSALIVPLDYHHAERVDAAMRHSSDISLVAERDVLREEVRRLRDGVGDIAVWREACERERARAAHFEQLWRDEQQAKERLHALLVWAEQQIDPPSSHEPDEWCAMYDELRKLAKAMTSGEWP